MLRVSQILRAERFATSCGLGGPEPHSLDRHPHDHEGALESGLMEVDLDYLTRGIPSTVTVDMLELEKYVHQARESGEAVHKKPYGRPEVREFYPK